MTTRRRFLQAAMALAPFAPLAGCRGGSGPQKSGGRWFEISLAQWSLHRSIEARTVKALDFAAIARRDYQLAAVEYVNSFYKEFLNLDTVINDLKRRSDGEGVRNVLIMCDGEGKLGDPDSTRRATAVTNHHKWIDAASHLGCHSIRVNASSSGTPDEQMKLVADGLSALTQYGDRQGINVIIENHGGLSSNGAWLAAAIQRVNHPRCGTLPDFGNFNYPGQPAYDRYLGVQELMPYAKGVSAKSMDFDAEGNETTIDYQRMLEIVRAAGYRGFMGIEYEGKRMSEPDGIRATKALLERLRPLV